GVAGSTTPAVYEVQSLTVSGAATLQVVGPVILNLANGVSFSGDAGSAAHPEWLTLNVAAGGVTLSGTAMLHGFVNAPAGAVSL
uniref:hypothetical protein n=1 Tax=Salmonella enterica TaxID=28901 RepID=UPI003299EF58